MIKTNQPIGLPEGIHFHIEDEDYHNDPALSHSGMTQILVSWQDYWMRSCLNPNRDEFKPTDAMKFGSRSEMYLLDRKRFDENYNTVRNYNAKGKGICLSTIEMARIVDSINCVLEVDVAREHFIHGYAQVTIVWRDPETGIMLRVKIDFLRVFGAIDCKRIKGIDNWTIGRAVKDQGLDIQHYLYLEGIKAGRKWLRAMSATQLSAFSLAQQIPLDWLTAFMGDEDLLFRFFLQRSTPPYIWQFRELDPEVVREGENATRKAILRYKQSIDIYGVRKPPMGSSEILTVSPFHVPRRDYDFA